MPNKPVIAGKVICNMDDVKEIRRITMPKNHRQRAQQRAHTDLTNAAGNKFSRELEGVRPRRGGDHKLIDTILY